MNGILPSHIVVGSEVLFYVNNPRAIYQLSVQPESYYKAIVLEIHPNRRSARVLVYFDFKAVVVNLSRYFSEKIEKTFDHWVIEMPSQDRFEKIAERENVRSSTLIRDFIGMEVRCYIHPNLFRSDVGCNDFDVPYRAIIVHLNSDESANLLIYLDGTTDMLVAPYAAHGFIDPDWMGYWMLRPTHDIVNENRFGKICEL